MYQNARKMIVMWNIGLALAVLALVLFWPAWRAELQAMGENGGGVQVCYQYYTCWSRAPTDELCPVETGFETCVGRDETEVLQCINDAQTTCEDGLQLVCEFEAFGSIRCVNVDCPRPN
jgi:hypothetical protein